MNTKHRVAITGIGMITPLGNNVATNWNNIIAGKSGISTLDESINLAGFSQRIAGIVRGEQALIDALIPAKNQPKADRFIHLAMVAAQEALHNAHLDHHNPIDRTRFGCYLGVGMGGLPSLSQAILALQEGYRKISPFTIPKALSNEASSWLSMTWDLQGPSAAISTACASSSDALGLAMRAIRDGYCDYMLAGGTESSLAPISIVAFGNMKALSSWTGAPEQASRPFDTHRSGFVIAEGAAMLLLERLDLAQQRGATIYAELAGYGATSDAYHLTAMHPDGKGAQAAINASLNDAQVAHHSVEYINAHGTATIMNDILESQTIEKTFGSHANSIAISSTKSMTGHMLGAAGAAEAAYTALAIHHGIIPPTINLTNQDPLCTLDYVPQTARTKKITVAQSNSFGFGGHNAVLTLKKI
ncbi:MAG: 3-oxoacyl-[acyl-carrier-protein] synthase 2 [candidate division TM6 bacterium GW2011_GWF2_38_10]|nr:MAG: 3-oxoacyl-[acyl-carrier-protein] synthase 2 [candidate division TM6 bacterium GW2011_GWF2_38_10]